MDKKEERSFQKQLNQYMETLLLNGKELAQYTGLSESIISRYRRGERIPAVDSIQLAKLSEGIAAAAAEKGMEAPDEEQIYQTFRESLLEESGNKLLKNEQFDRMIEEMQINVSRMAAILHYDPSFISKVRTGKRNPSEPEVFVEEVCGYVVSHYFDENGKRAAASMMGCSPEDLENPEQYRESLKKWMCFGKAPKADYVSGFLRKMDEFNLDDYIRAVHFDEMKVPKMPFQLPLSRHYFGLEEMREGELDFLKHTVLSKSMEPLYLCSDMPVEDMAEDAEFAKKYMFGLAMVLKKGLHIHIIHNVERPLKEMMLGLENWIPLYMTGQISPYYIGGIQNQVYSHLHYSSGAAAMIGECISGHHDMSHYYLTNNKTETMFYRKNMEFLMKKAEPLMNIFRKEQKEEFLAFCGASAEETGIRRRILSEPPLFVLTGDMLEHILERNGLEEEEKQMVLESWENERRQMERIFSHSSVRDELSILKREEYEEYPVSLPLSDSFAEKDIRLTYEEYRAGIQAALDYGRCHEQYELCITRVKGFRNIRITCLEEKWCMVSKNKTPAIHFVIRHPRLCSALTNISLPVRDE